jgi:hypothetical protein
LRLAVNKAKAMGRTVKKTIERNNKRLSFIIERDSVKPITPKVNGGIINGLAISDKTLAVNAAKSVSSGL